MRIAKELKERNVCEYLLYMWQVEDTIRAYGLDAERMAREYVPRFGLPEQEARDEAQWYEDLARMMREEGVEKRGHLQINRGTLSLLDDLHAELLRSTKHPFYAAAYYKALPFIVELRARGDKDVSELETCLSCVYGVMVLKMQHREVSEETKSALGAITHLLALLADAYQKERKGELEL